MKQVRLETRARLSDRERGETERVSIAAVSDLASAHDALKGNRQDQSEARVAGDLADAARKSNWGKKIIKTRAALEKARADLVSAQKRVEAADRMSERVAAQADIATQTNLIGDLERQLAALESEK